MAVRSSIILFAILFSMRVQGQPKQTIGGLRQQITDTLDQVKGDFALAFKDLSTSQELFIHEHEKFHAASTMKTPVLIELYKQAAQGKFLLSDSMVITNEFTSIVDSSPFKLNAADDGDTSLYQHIGEKLPISDLAYRMITLSSNLSTNLLVNWLDPKKVTSTMRGYGALDILVLRGVEDNKAYEKGLNNMVTAYDLMLVFEKIATGKAVSREASAAMIKILLDQHFNEIIPARLPANVKVAHKTGSFTGVHHDSGIVFLPDGRKYLLVILSRNLENDEAAVSSMASVSKMIYDYMMR